MTKLSVNINKIATLRNSRGGSIPNVLKVALDCERYGAEGITVHPRPDERHIKYADVYDLKASITTELNIEGYPSVPFIEMVCKVKPTQITLVPDAPEAITSNAGWDTLKFKDFLKEIIKEFKTHGIRTSIFIDPVEEQIIHAADTGADRIELYTEFYAKNYISGKELAIEPYLKAAIKANELGLGINAGHDLNLDNLKYFSATIPKLLEVSIGHALIADALYFGLENTIQMYKRQLGVCP